jgi:hypothetical protein
MESKRQTKNKGARYKNIMVIGKCSRELADLSGHLKIGLRLDVLDVRNINYDDD